MYGRHYIAGCVDGSLIDNGRLAIGRGHAADCVSSLTRCIYSFNAHFVSLCVQQIAAVLPAYIILPIK
jgi:hypothetical protein